MPRFFFNVRTDEVLLPDTGGEELPGPEGARMQAIEASREIIADGVRSGEGHSTWSIEVTDESGGIILTVPFSEAVE